MVIVVIKRKSPLTEAIFPKILSFRMQHNGHVTPIATTALITYGIYFVLPVPKLGSFITVCMNIRIYLDEIMI